MRVSGAPNARVGPGAQHGDTEINEQSTKNDGIPTTPMGKHVLGSRVPETVQEGPMWVKAVRGM